eukprot:scaffold1313_cov250-Pinguiococcus_pyrenoidosus.AAC.11
MKKRWIRHADQAYTVRTFDGEDPGVQPELVGVVKLGQSVAEVLPAVIVLRGLRDDQQVIGAISVPPGLLTSQKVLDHRPVQRDLRSVEATIAGALEDHVQRNRQEEEGRIFRSFGRAVVVDVSKDEPFKAVLVRVVQREVLPLQNRRSVQLLAHAQVGDVAAGVVAVRLAPHVPANVVAWHPRDSRHMARCGLVQRLPKSEKLGVGVQNVRRDPRQILLRVERRARQLVHEHAQTTADLVGAKLATREAKQ